jgi:hypothetical protein
VSLSYNKVWDFTAAIVRSHFTLLLAIAGVFSFLPGLLLNHFAPPPPLAGPDPDAALRVLGDYAQANWHWYLLWLLFGMAGTLAMAALILDPRRLTVRAAIGEGLGLLLTYVVCNVLIATLGGMLLVLIVTLLTLLLGAQSTIVVVLMLIPCLYAIGRIAILAPVIAAEDRRGPFTALSRTLALTRGKGWSIAGLVVAAFLMAGLTSAVARAIVGIPLRLLLEPGVATLIELIVAGAVGMVTDVLIIALYAAVYRTLTDSPSGSIVAD